MQDKAEGKQLRIVTYNLLSTELAEPSYHVGSDAKDLETGTRFERVKARLEPEIAQQAIFCFQEADAGWRERLQPFLEDKGYRMVAQSFAGESGVRLGVCIAYPAACKLIAARIVRVGAEIAKKRQSPKETRMSFVARCILRALITACWFVIAFLARLCQGQRCMRHIQRFKETVDRAHKKITNDPFQQAVKKQNVLICVRLAHLAQRSSFCICTYHMPCEPQNPQLMALHATTVASLVQQFAGDLPYIFVGDFNTRPSGEVYGIFTKGSSAVRPMQSAYREASARKREPPFTCHSIVKNTPLFSDCLDYIFYSEACKCVSVSELTSMPSAKSFPSSLEPSDHVMLAATLVV